MTVTRRSFLVVGGGIAGMSAAIALARTGAMVRLVEVDPDWRVYGAGITITGATYCAFAELGLLDELCARGFGALGGTRLCLADGAPFADLEAAALRPGIPPIGGIMRPVLHEMLARTTREAGVEVRLGTTVDEWHETASGVTATLSDGTQGDYAAIVIADGASSTNRARLFSEAPVPVYTGQYCWRLVAERPADIDRGHIYSAPPIFAGLIPTSPTAMYLWLLEPRAEKARIAPATAHIELRRIMAPFGGLLGRLRDGLDAYSSIVVRPLEAVLVPSPWHRGRAILIGDAAHATTPHLASGAGIAVEDAVLLARLLGATTDIEEAFTRFNAVRFERCRDVVDSSIAIGALQQTDVATPARLGALIGAAENRLQIDIWSEARAA